MFSIKEFIELYGKYLAIFVAHMSSALLINVTTLTQSLIMQAYVLFRMFVMFCYDHGITPLHLITLIVSLIVTYYGSMFIVRTYNYSIVLLRFFYFLCVGVKKTYPVVSPFYSAQFAAVKEVKDESAYDKNALPIDLVGLPKGAVQLFVMNDATQQLAFAGHATYCNGKYYTVLHTVVTALNEGSKVYVGTLDCERALPTTIDHNTVDWVNDTVQLHVGSTAAVLGVKSLKSKFVNKGYVTIYHFDLERKVYTATSVFADRFNDSFSPYVLFTQSNTSGGDSGLPVVQNGKFVASHKGAADKYKRNIHVLHHDLIINDVVTVSKRKQCIIPDVRILNETPTTIDQDDIDRAAAIANMEQEWKDRKMKGEHADEQGFRLKTKHAYDLANWKPRKGDRWADEDEDDVNDESDLKVDALQSAIEVPVTVSSTTPILRKEQEKSLVEKPRKVSFPTTKVMEKSEKSLLTQSSSPPPTTLSTKRMTQLMEEGCIVLEKSEVSPGAHAQGSRKSLEPSSTTSTSVTKKISSGEKRKNKLQRLNQRIQDLEIQLKSSANPQKDQ